MRQQLLWVPKAKSPRRLKVDFSERPKRVWTLFPFVEEGSPPELPFTPQHLTNAFLEDYIHDWKLVGGSNGPVFLYYSRVIGSDNQVWLLLEWDTP